MCYLRGLCYARQNAFDRARDCYKDAVRIDVQCFEAFDQLIKNSLMSPAEELDFLESLDFDSIMAEPGVAQEAAEFTKLLYTTRLSKYASPPALSNAIETLSTHYGLEDNPDMLLARAETLYTQCRFPEALELTSSILSSTPMNSLLIPQNSQNQSVGHSPAVYQLHLACLYETGATNSLFLLAHTLADNAPEEAYTYLAIGTYYMSVSKIAEARRFFSKASLLDPHSAPAWIGFAHTFAAEGEHDQAIAAYSTAARLFQGSHLPQLFLGMQNLALNNMNLAHEYLSAAYRMSCGGDGPGASSGGGDPLVRNELGVVLYHEGNLEGAAELFRQTLTLAAELECDGRSWLPTRANLGHALRRLGQHEEALAEFDECLRIGAGGAATGYSALIGGSGLISGSSASISGYEDRGMAGSLHTARGLTLLELGRTLDAVTALHEAVRVLGGGSGGVVGSGGVTVAAVGGGAETVGAGAIAAAGAGVASSLLSHALEIWDVESGDRAAFLDRERERQRQREKRERAERAHGTAKGGKRAAAARGVKEVNGPSTPTITMTPATVSRELESAEMELDGGAEDVLGEVLAKARRNVGAGTRPAERETGRTTETRRRRTRERP